MFRFRSWMRKIVGSNPGEGNHLSFVVSNRMEEFDGICDSRLKDRQTGLEVGAYKVPLVPKLSKQTNIQTDRETERTGGALGALRTHFSSILEAF